MNNIMQLINNAVEDKADNIIFSVENARGNILIKSNMNYWENNLSSNIEDSEMIANCFTQLFDTDFILQERSLEKIFTINNNNYKIHYKLIVKNENNFSINLKIKNTHKIVFNKKRILTDSFLLWEKMLKCAIENNVSDIHIQIRDYFTQEQVRIMFIAYGNVLHDKIINLTLKEGYALCKTIYNIVENKEIDNNETEDFMNVFHKDIHYEMENGVYKFAYGAMKCYPEGLDVVIRILPIDDVFKER